MRYIDFTMNSQSHPMTGFELGSVLYTSPMGDIDMTKITESTLPTMVDLEGGPLLNGYPKWEVQPYYTDLALRGSNFAAALDAIRAKGRTDLGLFGVVPIYSDNIWRLGPACTGVGWTGWHPANQTLWGKINGHVDALYPCAYREPNQPMKIWMDALQWQVTECHNLMGWKIPIRPVLRFKNTDEVTQILVQERHDMIDFCKYLHVEAICLWGNPQETFMAGLQ